MSINTADPNLNQNQQPPITNQPQAHQMTHNYNNKHLNYSTGTYQQQQTVGSTPAGNQMTNLNSGLSSGQLAAVAAGKKTGTGQPASQFKSNQQQQFKVGQTNPNNNNNQSPGYRKVFIQRDYSEGTSVRFQNKFPEELEGYIERQHFDYLITTLNCYYDKAEAGNLSTFCEGNRRGRFEMPVRQAPTNRTLLLLRLLRLFDRLPDLRLHGVALREVHAKDARLHKRTKRESLAAARPLRDRPDRSGPENTRDHHRTEGAAEGDGRQSVQTERRMTGIRRLEKL